MRKLLSALSLAAALVLVPAAAHADLITYNLVLTSTSGNAGAGTGSFTIDTSKGAGNSAQQTYKYSNGGLSALTFSIAGDTFTLADSDGAPGQTLVRFTNGVLDDIAYSGSESTKKATIALAANGLVYNFQDQSTSRTGTGTISDSLATAVAPAPEPGSLALLGTGVLGLAGIARCKFFA